MKFTKHLLLIFFVFLCIGSYAQESTTLTINVETAGTLPSLMPSSKKNEITNLTLTGFLNGTDIRYIREMAGCDFTGNSTEGKLSVLDLSKAKFVAGGEAYLRLGSTDYYSSLDSIGDYAFGGCAKLTSVTIPGSVTTIGYRAFYRCTELTSITIPDSVTTIGENAFGYCKGLTSITIPNSLTIIEDFAFAWCSGLTSVTIPNSVTTIKEGAFSDCTGLTSVTIPGSVTTIGKFVFFNCIKLTSVTIPASVTTIGMDAFAFCSQIKQIYCDGTIPPVINAMTFAFIYNTCQLFVPKGCSAVYRADPNWGKFINIIEQVTTSISDIEPSKTNVYTENGSIIVTGGKLGDTVDIYNVSGSLLHKIKVTDNIVRISVASQSFYIVKTGNKTFKIAMQ